MSTTHSSRILMAVSALSIVVLLVLGGVFLAFRFGASDSPVAEGNGDAESIPPAEPTTVVGRSPDQPTSVAVGRPPHNREGPPHNRDVVGRSPDQPTSVAVGRPPDNREVSADTISLSEEASASKTSEETPIEPAAEPTVEPESDNERLPAPDTATQKRLTEKLDETFDLDQLRTAEEKLQLARVLNKMADESVEAAEERFVLRRQAMQLASQANDPEFTMRLVDALAEEFEIDALGGKSLMLLELGSHARDGQSMATLIAHTDPVIDEAVETQRYDVALKLADMLYKTASRRSIGVEFRKRVLQRRRVLQDEAKRWNVVDEALELLETNPDDVAAKSTIADWYCFVQEDWQRGLPYLTASSNQDMAEAAATDRTSPREVADRIALGDSWWRLAETADSTSKQQALQRRAGVWYRLAMPSLLAGLKRTALEKRLDKIVPRPDLAGVVIQPEEPDATSKRP